MELKFFGLPCGMISKALNLVELLPVMSSINLVLCIGHVKVGIEMPYTLILLGRDDHSAYQELFNYCHPTSAPFVTVDHSMVLSSLKGFPKGTNPTIGHPNFVLNIYLMWYWGSTA